MSKQFPPRPHTPRKAAKKPMLEAGAISWDARKPLPESGAISWDGSFDWPKRRDAINKTRPNDAPSSMPPPKPRGEGVVVFVKFAVKKSRFFAPLRLSVGRIACKHIFTNLVKFVLKMGGGKNVPTILYFCSFKEHITLLTQFY